MAAIHIVQDHTLTPEQARAAAQQVADKIAREYGLTCAWKGNVLQFQRSGVDGELTLSGTQAQMVIRLGFLMSAFGSAIEAKVREKMARVFAG